jgi:hypothetical protein
MIWQNWVKNSPFRVIAKNRGQAASFSEKHIENTKVRLDGMPQVRKIGFGFCSSLSPWRHAA